MLLIFLLATEILTFIALRDYLYDKSRLKYFLFAIFNGVLTIWLWILYIEATLYRGIYDMPANIWTMMNLRGMITGVVVPRTLFVLFHFSGRLYNLFKNEKGAYMRPLTRGGFITAFVVFSILAVGSLPGRFIFKTEAVTVKIKNLHEDLDGLRIAQLSDLHLVSFYHHHNLLEKLMYRINSFEPDLIINSGDFINYGWREFSRFDTILSKATAEYGAFAVLGNHDIGTYHPHYTEADRANNILNMKRLIKASGYRLLNDEHTIVEIGDAKLAIAGVLTGGRFPEIIHSDVNKALEGIDSADMKLLILHDPDQWEKDVMGVTDVSLSLAGHTHGLQVGIIAGNLRWSPASFIYDHWHGLYQEGDQYLYVNRGLGVLGIPIRFWMPPEITLIELARE